MSHSYCVTMLLVMSVIMIPSWSRQSMADTSELGIGYDLALSQPIGIQTVHGARRSYETRADDHQTAVSSYLRVGLGLNFVTSLWMRIGLLSDQATLYPQEGKILCLDPQRETEINHGGIINEADQCLRQHLSTKRAVVLADVGVSYKPLDDLSPLFELSLGVSYTGKHQTMLNIDRFDAGGWRSINDSEQIHLPSTLRPLIQLGVGLEKRLLSRWGVRAAVWSRNDLGVSGQSLKDSFTLGIKFSLIIYHYVRLL